MTSTPLPYRVVLDTSPVVNGVRLESAIISSIGGTEPTLIAKVKLSYHSNPYDVGFTLGEVLPFQFPVLLKDLTKDLPDGQIFVSARQDDATGLITHDFSLQYCICPLLLRPPPGSPPYINLGSEVVNGVGIASQQSSSGYDGPCPSDSSSYQVTLTLRSSRGTFTHPTCVACGSPSPVTVPFQSWGVKLPSRGEVVFDCYKSPYGDTIDVYLRQSAVHENPPGPFFPSSGGGVGPSSSAFSSQWVSLQWSYS